MTYPSEKKAGRKQLSANALIDSVREGFEKISAHCPTGIKFSLTDVFDVCLCDIFSERSVAARL